MSFFESRWVRVSALFVGLGCPLLAGCDEGRDAVPCPNCLTGPSSGSGYGGNGGNGTGANDSGGAPPEVTLAWAKMWGGSGSEKAMSVAIDKDDYIYVAGYYTGQIAGEGAPALPKTTAYDSFVLKLRSDGNVEWEHSLGQMAPQPDGAQRVVVAVDSSNQLVLAGNIHNTTTVGRMNPAVFTQAGAEPELFVAKLSGDGTRIWAIPTGDGLAGIRVRDVACDSEGNVFIAGQFEADAGGQLFNETVDPVEAAMFVAKLSADGSPMWESIYPGTLSSRPHGLAVDANGLAVVAGEINAPTDFDGTMLMPGGGRDAFVAHFNAQGAVDWAHAYGNAATQSAADVAVDAAGGTYVTGINHGTIMFDRPFEVVGTDADLWVAKLDANGNPEWSAATKEVGGQIASSAAVLDEQLFIAGQFDNGMGLVPPGLPWVQQQDMFVASLGIDEAPLWSRALAGSGGENNEAVAVAPTSGAVVVVGWADGSLITGSETLMNGGSHDMVIARFEPAP
jgi:outer membrane protein assembly factor BamB